MGSMSRVFMMVWCVYFLAPRPNHMSVDIVVASPRPLGGSKK